MLSGVPQGSVLGPILFLLYDNDLPNWITCSMRMFADDTKIWNIIKSDSDCSDPQMDIDVLVHWSNKWLLHFNTDECKVISLGHSVHHDYCITDHSGRLELTSCQEPVKKRTLASLSQTTRSLKTSL